MKVNNKLVKVNTFDILDTESFEEYLSKMALEGWAISKIGKIYITFEKSDPRVEKFFVDITDKKLIGDNYIPTKDYINSYEERGLKHVCGNDFFQIFINKGSKEKVDKSKMKFFKVFGEDIALLISFALIFAQFFIGNSVINDYFTRYISDNFLLIWFALSGFIVLINIILIILKFFKYMKMKKEDNHSFREFKSNKIKDVISRCARFSNLFFIIISIMSIVTLNLGENQNISNDKMPLSLEDFNVKIEKDRESYKYASSSIFAKYFEYSDSTYIETSTEVYDEETDTYYTEYEDINSCYLSYSLFESKYEIIIDKALKSTLKFYDDYGYEYKKLTDKKEIKNWGSKEVYVSNLTKERIVVYEDKIVKFNYDMNYNKENIEMIKRKILN